jgi:oligopeptide/dipeptide ABC transporter ATP-binding protein
MTVHNSRGDIKSTSSPSNGQQIVLAVRGLVTSFRTDHGTVKALDGVGFTIKRGRTLGVVGESGCGKSVTSLSIMRLLPSGAGRIDAGEILFDGRDLTKLSEHDMRRIRGNRMAMIFQEPMTALNPVFTAGDQIMEVFITHRHMTKDQARQAALKMMEKVRIPDPERRLDEYPHQMSGGMKQRIMIAMALACEPAVIIADEPTTALDVTIQAQILRLMQDLQRETGTAIMFITHDLGVIAEIADDVVVMYAGQVVERADVESIFDRAMHPYTQGLLASIPRADHSRERALPTIGGAVPSLKKVTDGCRFYDRCTYRQERCVGEQPKLVEMAIGHEVACHFAGSIADGSIRPRTLAQGDLA